MITAVGTFGKHTSINKKKEKDKKKKEKKSDSKRRV